jgi:hypothetical protein
MLMFMLRLAQSLAAAEAEKREVRAKKRAAKRKRTRTMGRLPLWFRHVTIFLCLAYCSVMALVTIVYGIKFTLRGEELARQQDLKQWTDINITYFDSESTNASISMMSFELNESIALNRKFVTLEELVMRRFGNVTSVTDYDVDMYANDTVKIVRPVAEEEEVYLIFGQKGTYTDLSTSTDSTNSTDLIHTNERTA